MSARVFNPAVMSELRKGLFGGEGGRATSSSVPASAVQRVRRDLFGPVDHAEIEQIMRRELDAQQVRDADRWGFDFERGSPRRDGPGTSRWVWKKVMPGEGISVSYSHRRLTYLNTTTAPMGCDAAPTTTSSDEKATMSEPSVPADNNNKQTHITDYLKSSKKRPVGMTSEKAVTSEKLSPPSKQAKTETSS